MTITVAPRIEYSCVRLVLRPSESSNFSISLNQWLARLSPQLGWVSLGKMGDVNRLMLVLPDYSLYPHLLEAIAQLISEHSGLLWQEKPFEILGIETDTQDLHSFNLSIYPQGILPSYLGRALHALCLQWFAYSDPQLSEQLHDQEMCPFTIFLDSHSPRQQWINITVFQRHLLSPLLWGLSQSIGQEISLTSIPCKLAKSVKWVRSSSFQSLLDLPPQSSLRLNFLSPTSFKQQDIIQPFPLTDLVFGSLWRKWNTFAPSSLVLPTIPWQGLISGYDLKTQGIQLKNHTEIGSIGWVKYQFKDPEQAQLATTLAHFTTFCGVGRKTGLGMGKTSLSDNHDR